MKITLEKIKSVINMTMSLKQRELNEKWNTLQVRQKNQWTIQGSPDTCKWYFRVKSRCLRETQHKKGYTVQRAHSHIITDVHTTG
jgi:hypothetical protein